MDLNTALMESITSMSEYFVAANTRTSFTELAESGSISSLTNQSATNSTNNQQANNLNQQFSQPNPVHKALALNQSQTMDSMHHSHPNSNNNNNSHSSSSSLHNPFNQSRNQFHSHSYPAHSNTSNTTTTTTNNNNNNSNSVNTSTSSTSSSSSSSGCNNIQTRLNQPVRTQIPIHCYIEQLDACADIPGGYTSSLTDNDLFNTTNSLHTDISNNINNNNNNTNNKPSATHNHQQQNHDHNHPHSHLQHHNHHHSQHQQPHLHQSKLALESVTNSCNVSTSLETVTNPVNLFNENDTNNDISDLDGVDTNIDQLNSDSPLSIHHQNIGPSSTNVQANNSICSTNINRQASTFDNHQFQACRETYAIVTSNVLYIDLVRTVLLQLGYSAMDLINAKATIQIKNWRPLAMDQVTEDKRATVGEVLGDISTFVTLRIRLYSPVTHLPTEWTETMIRQVVLALTQTMSQLTLSKLCNISQPLISSIVRGGKKLGRRKCAEFGQWYMNYIKSAEARPLTMFCEGGGARLVFDKSREIPQLKAWFANNTKPSDELLEEYSKILNEHALRKDRPQVTAKALKNWWKNERQKLGIRQREFRGRPKLKRID